MLLIFAKKENDFEDVKDMRDKCLLTGQDSKSRLPEFIEFDFKVERLIEVLSVLRKASYPESKDAIEIKKTKSFYLREIKARIRNTRKFRFVCINCSRICIKNIPHPFPRGLNQMLYNF